MNRYKIIFDFELEVECKEEDINNEVLEWIFHNDLYPLYKIETIEGDDE